MLEIAVNLFLSFGMIVIAIGFLEGYFSGKQNSRWRVIIPFERIVFRDQIDNKVIQKVDQLNFLISLSGGLLTIANTILIYFAHIENISMLFLFISLILVWPARIIFIAHYKNRQEKLPKIWFFNN